MNLKDLHHPAATLPPDLDGFRVEISHEGQRADIILCRPPFNIVKMGQRDQLRVTFEALDANPMVRVIVLRAEGEHFSSGGDIKGRTGTLQQAGDCRCQGLLLRRRV